MNIFLTGGTGFIGSNILNKININQHNILCLKRGGSVPRIKLKKQPEWVSVNRKSSTNLYKDIDLFIHCAAYGVHPQKSNWIDSIQYNVFESMK